MIRAFVALWPDERTRGRLAQAAHALAPPGCRIVPPANLHLTLVFVGAVAADRLPDLEACLPRSEIAPFELSFAETGHFPHARVAWIAPVSPPDALSDLQRFLAAKVAAAGFEVDRRRFHPHVTIARGCAAAPRGWDMPPVIWTIDRVALCRSDSTPAGVRYSVVAMR